MASGILITAACCGEIFIFYIYIFWSLITKNKAFHNLKNYVGRYVSIPKKNSTFIFYFKFYCIMQGNSRKTFLLTKRLEDFGLISHAKIIV